MKVKNIVKCCFLLFFFISSSIFAETKSAIFAAGCFWCAEHDFEKIPGVIKAVSGYTGGRIRNPSYEQVSAGGTGHYESIEVIYDPKKINYSQLLAVFWHNIDPTDAAGQFCDRGDQYRAAIFYQNAEEKEIAEASKNRLLKTGKIKFITTQILPVSTFYPAEEYHQQYARKNPLTYRFYRCQCGRDKKLKEIWG